MVAMSEGENNYQGVWATQPSSTARKSRQGVTPAVCFLIALGTGLVCFALGTRFQNVSFNTIDYGSLREVYDTLQQKFDGKLDKTKLEQGAVRGLVAGAEDPYTVYLTDEEAKALTDDLAGSFEGIGIAMGISQDKQLQVMSILDGGPAQKAGLKSGDLIAAIDGEPSLDLHPAKAAKKIRGPIGTEVKLTIIRGTERKDFILKRDKITTPSVTWRKEGDFGYIRVSQFGADTASLMNKAGKELTDQHVKGLVLDLRDNGGGYVDAAQDLAGMWLPKGNVVVQERRGSQVMGTLLSQGEPTLNQYKTVVLINGGSASAAEILAGALHDYGRATLLGEKSYGKGSVQQLLPIDGGQLKVTVAKWYTPKGKNINHEGIKPDKEVKLDAEQIQQGHDNQLQAALDELKK